MAAKLGRLTGRSSDYWLKAMFIAANGTRAAEFGEPARAELRTDFRRAAIMVNHQIIRAVHEGLLGIDPFTAKNVQRASVDLTLHDFIITPDGQSVDITEGQSFTLQSGQ